MRERVKQFFDQFYFFVIFLKKTDNQPGDVIADIVHQMPLGYFLKFIAIGQST